MRVTQCLQTSARIWVYYALTTNRTLGEVQAEIEETPTFVKAQRRTWTMLDEADQARFVEALQTSLIQPRASSKLFPFTVIFLSLNQTIGKQDSHREFLHLSSKLNLFSRHKELALL